MTAVAVDRCLQCGKPRSCMKDPYNYPCATAQGYEVIEGLDDWDRHHWRDWSDAELRRFGVLPEAFDRHRRDDFYDFQYIPCLDSVLGHLVSKVDNPEFGWKRGQCVECGQERIVVPEPRVPKRIQMSRQKPWRADNPDAVIVARPSKWGNPYPVEDGDRAAAVEEFREMLDREPHIDEDEPLEYTIRRELRGRDLACWCPLDQPCHADLLLEIANTDEWDLVRTHHNTINTTALAEAVQP